MASMKELIGNADAFPVLAERDYFNHAGCCPLPAVARDAICRLAGHFARRSFLDMDLGAPAESMRSTGAALLNADPDEVALLQNTSECISQVAGGLEWRAGDRIVFAESEYPSNQYPWMEVARRFGAELVRVPEQIDDEGRAWVDPDALLVACDHPRTKLLALSHVQWGTGQCFDLEPIGRFCRERGILFSVDAIQTLGVVPIDVKRCHVDFLHAGSHKWMLGPMGAAIFFIRRELVERVRPITLGWLNFRDPMKWEQIDFTLREGAVRYEYGTPALPSIAGTAASLAMLHDVGIENVQRRVRDLGNRFSQAVSGLGYRVVSPRHLGCGGAVCFVPRDGEARPVFEAMSRQHETELAFRCGRVRFSPHFYNTEQQVDRVLERLASLANGGDS